MTDPQCFAPGARNREDEVLMRGMRVLVVVALAVDPPPWTPDPRSRNSHTANPASALQENGAQFCAYDQKAGLSFPNAILHSHLARVCSIDMRLGTCKGIRQGPKACGFHQ